MIRIVFILFMYLHKVTRNVQQLDRFNNSKESGAKNRHLNISNQIAELAVFCIYVSIFIGSQVYFPVVSKIA